MERSKLASPLVWIPGGFLILFVLGQLLGTRLFDNGWSFQFWSALPQWWPLAWIAEIALVAWLLTSQSRRLVPLFESWQAAIGPGLGLLVLLYIAQADSFAAAGGNVRVAQIAQNPYLVERWFEFGTIHLAHALWTLFGTLISDVTVAGVAAWKTVAFLSAGLSMWACWLFAKEICRDDDQRPAVFLLSFLGPQLVVYFGYIGLEPVVVAATTWLLYYGLRLLRSRRRLYLAALWLTLAAGTFMTASMVYLLPAASYVSLAHFSKRGRSGLMAVISGVVVTLVMLVGLYWFAGQDFALAKHLLFLDGKSPFGDYGLFSLRHLGDIAQLFLLVVPVVLWVKLALPKLLRQDADSRPFTFLMFAAWAGSALVFIIDPRNSIVMDLPRLLAYLTPTGLLIAFFVANRGQAKTAPVVGIATTLIIALNIGYLPVYLQTEALETVADQYFEKHDWYYRTGCLSFRDTYFYQKDMNRANYWDQRRPIASSDVLNLRGVTDLVVSDRVPEATNILYGIVARNRWWIEPRSALAGLLMRSDQLSRAKAQIDTLKMIDPFRRESLMNDYIYVREQGDYSQTRRLIEYALEILPGDPELLTDHMLILHRLGSFRQADSMATTLIQTNPTLPYPFLIRAMYQSSLSDTAGAIRSYQMFLGLHPEAPEKNLIKARLQELQGGTGTDGN